MCPKVISSAGVFFGGSRSLRICYLEPDDHRLSVTVPRNFVYVSGCDGGVGKCSREGKKKKNVSFGTHPGNRRDSTRSPTHLHILHLPVQTPKTPIPNSKKKKPHNPLSETVITDLPLPTFLHGSFPANQAALNSFPSTDITGQETTIHKNKSDRSGNKSKKTQETNHPLPSCSDREIKLARLAYGIRRH